MEIRRSPETAAPKWLPALSAAALATALFVVALAFGAASAHADVGVEKVSRRGGEPGTTVTLTLGCGFCFPPCVGPKGERHPKGFEHGPCMLGTKGQDPPASFGISLVPLARAPQLRRCGSGPVCIPQTLGAPRRAPFTFLGRAVPPPGGNDPAWGDPPRYILRFAIPDLRPGAYAYEIWCGVCVGGKRGALLGSPQSQLWRLRVRTATASTRPGIGNFLLRSGGLD